MKYHGFTLVELLLTLTVITIIITLGIPSLSEQLRSSRLKTASLALIESIETARSVAVFRNKRTLLRPTNGAWDKGWELFVDNNDDGIRTDDEELLSVNSALSGVVVSAPNSSPLKKYISFIGSGEGRKTGKANGGAFLAGSLKVCPEVKGGGLNLILSRGGRLRMKSISAADCGF